MDKRVRQSKEAVLGVTLEMLYANGLGGVSVDEVSRRSGVAKTTIYRHWKTRSDLLIDACSQLITQQNEKNVPDTGSFEGDLTAQLSSLANLLKTARWSSVLPSIIDAAERDPKLAEVLSKIQKGHMAPFHYIMRRAKHRGKLSSDVDQNAVVSKLVGPLFYRRWFTREPIDDEFVKEIIKTVASV